ncbi:hypothetical protein [Salinibaculum rarum]|uniref:hypothetical protein n=1 Tax=Salinibaculum rarum TaxID=3058903 RepID=UPI00265DA6D6|nr:hypothetical protein [Salinibaculum sp. KK48]
MIPKTSVEPVSTTNTQQVRDVLTASTDTSFILTFLGEDPPHDALDIGNVAGLLDVEEEQIVGLNVTAEERDGRYEFPKFTLSLTGAETVTPADDEAISISVGSLRDLLLRDEIQLLRDPTTWENDAGGPAFLESSHPGQVTVEEAVSAFFERHGGSSNIVDWLTIDGGRLIRSVKTIEGVFDINEYDVTSLVGSDPTLLHTKTTTYDGTPYVKTLTGYPGPVYVDPVDAFVRKLETGQYIPAKQPTDTGGQVENFSLAEKAVTL